MISKRSFLLFILLCSVVNMRLIQDFVFENEETTIELVSEGEDENENNESEETDESIWLFNAKDFQNKHIAGIHCLDLKLLITIKQDYKSPFLERKYSPPRLIAC